MNHTITVATFEEGTAFRNHPLISSAHARGENRNVFEAFIRDFVLDLQPRGPVEATFAARAAGLAWRLNRAQKLETVVLSRTSQSDGGHIVTGLRDRYARDNIEMISRWEQSLERSLLKTLDAFEQLQKRRGAKTVPANSVEIGPEIDEAIRELGAPLGKVSMELTEKCK